MAKVSMLMCPPAARNSGSESSYKDAFVQIPGLKNFAKYKLRFVLTEALLDTNMKWDGGYLLLLKIFMSELSKIIVL